MNFIKKFYKKLLYLYKNIVFLTSKDLSLYLINKDNVHHYLDNIKFEIQEDLLNTKKPIIADPIRTIEKIINEKVSISRFGDGEFELLLNKSIPFQESSLELSKRLEEIITTRNENIIIGIPYFYWNSLRKYNNRVKNFIRGEVSIVRKTYESKIDFSKQYYSTEFTQLYMAYGDNVNMDDYFNNLRKIWQNLDIAIIQGEGIFLDFEFNIFDNAKTIEYMYAPSTNAFFEYDKIYKKACSLSKDKLILIVLGPTATVLSYDLANNGYWALDMGHTAKDFDYYKKQVEKNDFNLESFLSPD